MRSFVSTLLLILLNLVTFHVYASGPTVRFEHINKDDGLSQNTITSIMQDKDGFLWFGTRDGLNRYDGYEINVFRHMPKDPNSVADNSIGAITQVKNGDIWVGTRGAGISIYDPKTNSFSHIVHDSEQPDKSLSQDVIRAIFEDSNGIIWIGTSSGGLNRYNPVSKEFKHFKFDENDKSSISNNRIYSIIQDTQGTIWVGTGRGLNKFNARKENFERFIHLENYPYSLSNNTVRRVFEDSNKNLWVGTQGGGLNLYNPQTNAFTSYKHNAADPYSISHNEVIDISEDNNGNLLIGTWGGGLNRFNTINKRFYQMRSEASNQESLSNDFIYTMYNNGNDIFWIGTTGGGVNKYDADKSKFGHYRHLESDPDSLSEDNVRSIYKDSYDVLWVGTRGGGLNRYDELSGKFTHYKHDPSIPSSISDGPVFTIYEDQQRRIWVGTARGLNLFERESESFTHFTHDKENPNSLSGNDIRSIYQDDEGLMWIGTYRGGLNKFDEQTNTFTRYQHHTSNLNSISHNSIRAILQDSKGKLWIGTGGGGLNSFNIENEEFTIYRHDKEDSTSISHNEVFSILEARDGQIWVATRAGLNKLNSNKNGFEQFRREHGLPNDSILGLVEDNAGFLWISTNEGLSKFNTHTKEFRNYDAADGLQSNEFGLGASFISADNTIYFGGINGFNAFNPKDISDNAELPNVVLTDFQLANQSVDIKVPNQQYASDVYTIDKTINRLDELVLTYKESLVSFEFAALHYADPMKNKYAYKLEGWDNDWVYTDSKRRFATYTKLDADTYIFKVKASNKDGRWNEQPKTLKVIVEPPPWETWWAYTIYIISIIALVYAFVYNQQQKVLYERSVNRKLKQVDRLKDQFLANTSHELRTPLNGIIGLAESLIDGVAGNLPALANQNLAMVVTSGKRLSNLVNDLLDFSKLKDHNIVLHTKALDLHDMANVVLTMSRPLVGDKQLELINKVPTKLQAVEADEDRLLQILHNLIGNAIKFTEKGHVTVEAAIIKDRLKVSIIDTGIGIPEDKFEAVFESFEQIEDSATRLQSGTGLGLAVSKQLVELHGGIIELESTLDVGSTFHFTLPLSQNEAEKTKSQQVSRLHIIENVTSPMTNSAGEQITGEFTLSDRSDNVFPATLSEEEEENNNMFRILLVDDEPINRQVLRNHLSMQNYQIVEASGGYEALQAVEQSEPFDLVLLDIMMPRLSGYEVCQKLREQWPVYDLPIIFLTAKNQVADLVQSFEVGANDYLSKPIAKHELLTRVKTHLKLLDVHRNLENKVAQRTKALEQATQAKSDFLAKMSHEIRTPMNAVIGLSRLTLKTQLDPQQKDYVEKVVDAGEALLGLINDILDFSKIEAGKLTIENTRFRLDKLLQRSINLSAMNAHAKGLEIITDIDNSIPPILMGDPLRLQQIIVNLVNNAVKFTETGAVCIKIGIIHSQKA